MRNRTNEMRLEAAGKAMSLTSYMDFTELKLPGNVDEVSLLFATEGELEDFRKWAITDARMDNFASVPNDVAVCVRADWYDPMTSEVLMPQDLETFAVRFEFLRLPAAQWRVEAMCILTGTAPLHEAWLDRCGSGCVVHVSYKLPSRAEYNLHTAVGPGSSLWADQPVLRAEYGNSYGRFAYYQHDNFVSADGRHAWFLKPRVNERD